MIVLGSPFSFVPGTLQSAIDRLGLTSGLKLCLDASDINSYSGSGQNWLDTSGAGSNFYRGSGSGADSADPTFNGNAGGQSSAEYFSFDGGDYCTISTANPAWVNNLFKDGAIGSCAVWLWVNTTTAVQGIAGCTGNSGGAWNFSVNANNTFGWIAEDDSLNDELILTSSGTVTEDAWQFLGFAVNETGNSHRLHINGTNEEKTGTFPSPSSTNTDSPLRIGSQGTIAAATPIESGGRIAAIAFWDTALSASDLTALYNVTRGKFGV